MYAQETNFLPFFNFASLFFEWLGGEIFGLPLGGRKDTLQTPRDTPISLFDFVCFFENEQLF